MPVQATAAQGRFQVSLSPHVVSEFQKHGLNLPAITRSSLARVAALLPGPSARVALVVGDPAQILGATGVSQFTDPESGAITIGFFGTWSFEPAGIELSLPRALAHEALRSVRVLRGPGLGTTLSDQLVEEGLASAFDEAAFPGTSDPWVGALSPSEECRQWQQLTPALGETGLFDQVMFGGPVQSSKLKEDWVPALTGMAIGYRLAAAYLARHPKETWAELAVTPSRSIIASSGYRPCATSAMPLTK